MHRRLFGFDKSQLVVLSDADLRRILRELRAAPELETFRVWLVGSRLEPGKESLDIDLVLSPRREFLITDMMVERALWYCRDFGLHQSKPPFLIDPCFRSEGPTLAITPLQPQTVFQTCKLFSPKLAKLVRKGQLLRYRRFGRFSIEYLRRAEDTDYYAKLPSRIFDSSASAYLRPAAEIPLIADPV